MVEDTATKARKLAEEAQANKKKVKEAAKSSAIPSKLGQTETVEIGKGSHAYSVTLCFTGTADAMHTIEDARGTNGQINPSDAIELAIENGIVSAPTELIDKGLAFFDNHDGSVELGVKIFQFLNKKLQ